MLDAAMRAANTGMERSSATRTVQPNEGSEPLRLAAGARVGRYLVMDEIGRGAMGVVLQAYDPRLQREIALKLVGSASLSAEAQDRMLREGQAMAKLSHPNVVAVYDVELIAGSVALAMEYVRGTTLASWLERASPDCRWWAVVSSFVAAGRGLAAAHAAGVLHRDFKPTNVLVGDDHRVRVGDFGLACVHGRGSVTVTGGRHISGTSASEHTQPGEMLGTPRYMAPEQHGGGDVGPAADQYAFCVALWESLTGARAFPGGADGGLAAKHRGPPAWPSDPRHPTPARIAKAIERGLDPVPSRRWPTLEAMLDVLAREPRRRVMPWIASGSGLSIVAVSGLVWAQWSAERARRCTGGAAQIEAIWNAARRAEIERAMLATGLRYADDTWRRIESRLDTYAVAWAATHREACEATTVRREQTPAVLDLRMGCLQQNKVDLGAIVDVLARADVEVAQKAHEIVDGLRDIERCSDIDALQTGEELPSADEQDAVASARERLAPIRVLYNAGKYSEAQTLMQELSAAVTSLAYRPLHAELAMMSGWIARKRGDLVEARASFAVAFRHALGTKRPSSAMQAALALLGTVGWSQGRVHEASAYIPVIAGLSRKGGHEEAAMRGGLGMLYARQGRLEDAEGEYRAALALYEATPSTERRRMGIRSNLANLLQSANRPAEAEVEQRIVLDMAERAYGREHPVTNGYRGNLANTLDMLERDEEAEAMHRETIEVAERMLGPDHPEVGMGLNNLGWLLYRHDRFTEARDVLHRAIELWEKLPPHPDLTIAHSNMALVASATGHHEEANPHYRRVLQVRLELYGRDHPDVAWARKNYAKCLLLLGRPDAAREQLELAFPIMMRSYGEHGIEVAFLRADLAESLAALGHLGQAEREMESALTSLRARMGATHDGVQWVEGRRDAMLAKKGARR